MRRSQHKTNLQKHGIDFVGIDKVFEGTTITFVDDRFDFGEDRFLTIGLLEGVLVIAHTEPDEKIRIISVRTTSRNEEENYFREIAD